MAKKTMKRKKYCLACVFVAFVLMFSVVPVMGADVETVSVTFTDPLTTYEQTETGYTKTYSNGANVILNNDTKLGDSTYTIEDDMLKITSGIKKNVAGNAAMALELEDGKEFSGKVEINFSIRWAFDNSFTSNIYLDLANLVQAYDSDGDHVNLIGVHGTYLYFGSDVNNYRCSHPSCSETYNHYKKNYTMNMVSNARGAGSPYLFQLYLDFDKGTAVVRTKMIGGEWVDFYGNGVTAGDIDHPVTWSLGNVDNLKKLVFNFPPESGEDREPYIEFGELSNGVLVRNLPSPTYSTNVTDGDNAVDPENGKLCITFNSAISQETAKKIQLYKRDVLIETPEISLSEDGKVLTFEEPLTYSTNYKVAVPEGLKDIYLQTIDSADISFRTMEEDLGLVISNLSVTEPVAGETLTATVNCCNEGGKARNITFLVIAYKDGIMENIGMQTILVEPDGNEEFSVELDMPENIEGVTCKTFVWEDFAGIQRPVVQVRP